MFHRKNASGGLPTTLGGPKRQNPLAAGPEVLLPKMQTATWMSWLWLVASILGILLGIRLVSAATDIREVKCDSESCMIRVQSWEAPEDNMEVRIPRTDLIKAEQVRLRHGKIRDTTDMKRKQARKLGFSYAIWYREAGEEKGPLAMSVTSLRRSRPRVAVRRVTEFLDEETSQLDLTESSGFDWRGLLLIIFGVLSLLFAALLGQFSDPKPKPKKRIITRKRAS